MPETIPLPGPQNQPNQLNSRKKRSKGFWLFVLLLSLFLIVILAICVVLGLSRTNPPEPLMESNPIVSYPISIPIIIQPTALAQTYNGKFITATLPQNWTITESSDFSNETVSDSQYSGLARLVLLYKNIPIVTIHAGYGIGSDAHCDIMAKFKDTSVVYLKKIQNINKEVGSNPPVVQDLTKSTYTSSSLFGNEIRRVDNKLYFRADSEMDSFNPSCGFDSSYREFNGIYFYETAAKPMLKLNSYLIDQSIIENLSAGELQQLDQILSSLQGK